MEGGDLMKFLRNRGTTAQECALTEDEARGPLHQILSAVSYAHNQHICHRDLKLENLLLKTHSLECVKVADFGLSDFYRPGTTQKTNCGTLSFLAPEVFKGTSNAGPPLDVWSLGVILFSLLCGRLPFEGPDLLGTKRPRDAVIRSRIMKSQFKLDDNLSPEAKDMVRRMLKPDPLERATIPEIFNHCWFRSINNSHELVVRSRSSSRSYDIDRVKGDNSGSGSPKILTPRTLRGGIDDSTGGEVLNHQRIDSDEGASGVQKENSKEKKFDIARSLSSERLASLAQSVAAFEITSIPSPRLGGSGIENEKVSSSTLTLTSDVVAAAIENAPSPTGTFKITPLRRTLVVRNDCHDELEFPPHYLGSTDSPRNRSSPLLSPSENCGDSNRSRNRAKSFHTSSTLISPSFEAARSQSPHRVLTSPLNSPTQFWDDNPSPSVATSTSTSTSTSASASLTKPKVPLEKRNSTGSLKDSTASPTSPPATNSQRPLFSSPFLLTSTSAKVTSRKSLAAPSTENSISQQTDSFYTPSSSSEKSNRPRRERAQDSV